jgi:hypothetical protein
MRFFKSRRGRAVAGADLPPANSLAIDGYDRLAVRKIIVGLPQLFQEQLTAVESYERAHRQRAVVLQKLRYLRSDEPVPGYDALSPTRSPPLCVTPTWHASTACASTSAGSATVNPCLSRSSACACPSAGRPRRRARVRRTGLSDASDGPRPRARYGARGRVAHEAACSPLVLAAAATAGAVAGSAATAPRPRYELDAAHSDGSLG